jgi:predicted transposase YbfD/YdcC
MLCKPNPQCIGNVFQPKQLIHKIKTPVLIQICLFLIIDTMFKEQNIKTRTTTELDRMKKLVYSACYITSTMS